MNILTYYRKKAGLTQAELAAKTGIPQPNISRIERGEREIGKVSLETAVKLSEALEIHTEELLGEEPIMWSLEEITGQESGIVLYDDGSMLICNWAGGGLPKVSPLGGLIGLGDDLEPEGDPEHIPDIGAWLDGRDHDLMYDANDDYDSLWGTSGTLYRVSGVTVIAPDGWC